MIEKNKGGNHMIYTKLTKKALRICFDAHKDQVDKNGMPYVFHPFHLAEQMKDEYTTCVALLHDVVEDSAYSLQDLTNAGFPEEVVHAVARMSHDIFEPYMDYVRTLSTDPLARTVKLADLAHNCDLTRLDHITEADRKRVQKYQKAMDLLKRAESA